MARPKSGRAESLTERAEQIAPWRPLREGFLSGGLSVSEGWTERRCSFREMNLESRISNHARLCTCNLRPRSLAAEPKFRSRVDLSVRPLGGIAKIHEVVDSLGQVRAMKELTPIALSGIIGIMVGESVIQHDYLSAMFV